MNDERLIQLLRETPPEDLSRDEIRELRRRLPQSGELRQALFEHLQLDQALSEALGGVNLSPESIARRATTITAGGAGRLFGWGTISAVLLGLLGIGALVAVRWDRRPRQVAAADSGGAEAPARVPRAAINHRRHAALKQSPTAAPTESPNQEKQPSAADVEVPRRTEPAPAIEQ
ncbi:MAG TPA: hypothetical protein VJ783_21225, partial [Pirellulales bacterium]|nr:hypothetical protein [Pirellulales bacterium]